jgi:hypothetical protein
LRCTLPQIPGQLTVLTDATAKERAKSPAGFQVQSFATAASLTPTASYVARPGKTPGFHVRIEKLPPKGGPSAHQQVRFQVTHPRIKSHARCPTCHLD